MDRQDALHPNDAEYRYDANGNQTADLNKGIAWIRYNLLNFPEKIQFRNKTKNEYLYDASGVKHSAMYNYSTSTVLIPLGDTDPLKENNLPSTFQTDYCGNYVYEKSGSGNPVLKRINTPEGYIYGSAYGSTVNWNFWMHVYALKDHLGNTRKYLTSYYITSNTTKIYGASEQIDYYPFGMERCKANTINGYGPMAVYNSAANPYLYSGKEIDRLNGLNEYDFSARWLDNAVPGFTTSDPLVENHPWESPYSYCGANPVNRTDPTGLEWCRNSDKELPIWSKTYSQIVTYKYHNFTDQAETETGIWNYYQDGSSNFFPFSSNPAIVNGKKNFNFTTNLQYSNFTGGGDFGNASIANNSTEGGYSSDVNQAVREETKNLINTGLIKATYNVDVFKTNNPSNKTTVVTDLHKKQVSVSTNGLTIGNDGSVTFGDSFSVGKNIKTGDFILGITIPNGTNSNAGITINLDDRLVKGIAIGAAVVGGIVSSGVAPAAEVAAEVLTGGALAW